MHPNIGVWSPSPASIYLPCPQTTFNQLKTRQIQQIFSILSLEVINKLNYKQFEHLISDNDNSILNLVFFKHINHKIDEINLRASYQRSRNMEQI